MFSLPLIFKGKHHIHETNTKTFSWTEELAINSIYNSL